MTAAIIFIHGIALPSPPNFKRRNFHFLVSDLKLENLYHLLITKLSWLRSPMAGGRTLFGPNKNGKEGWSKKSMYSSSRWVTTSEAESRSKQRQVWMDRSVGWLSSSALPAWLIDLPRTDWKVSWYPVAPPHRMESSQTIDLIRRGSQAPWEDWHPQRSTTLHGTPFDRVYISGR